MKIRRMTLLHRFVEKFITHGCVCTAITKNIILHVTFERFHPELIHTAPKYFFGLRKDDEWKRLWSYSFHSFGGG
jgi:hypothetical protein